MVLALVVLGGCSSDSENEDSEPSSLEQIAQEARDLGRDWQAGILEDGDITLAEYDEGHRRNLTCLDDVGITYSEPQRSVLDGYSWNYDMFWPNMDDSKGQDVSYKCFEENLESLSVAMTAWGDWKTDAAVLSFTNECVTQAGFTVESDVQNYRELWLSAAGEGLTQDVVANCLNTAMIRLHPGVSYALGF